MLTQYTDTKIPELKHSKHHIEAKKVKSFLIAKTNTSLSPHTMVIHFEDAFSTGSAMRYPGRLGRSTKITVKRSRTVGFIEKFLGFTFSYGCFLQMSDFVRSVYGGEVAPETHENVEIY